METSDKILCNIISNSKNLYQVCKALNIKATNNNYKKIKKFISEHNLNVEHFNSVQDKKEPPKRYPDEIVYCENSAYQNTNTIRKRLLRDGIKEHKCERCKRTEWEGVPIPLQVHHLNGNNRDNRLENLQLLCPNCHALTDTYCGRAKKKKEKIKKARKDTSPSKEELIKAFILYNNFWQVGKYFNVSDNCIRKWCKKRNLPFKTKEMQIFLKDNYNMEVTQQKF